MVVPCYNQGQFLGDAIESVLTQSYPNFELIVVDDGSTDNTAEVARRYSAAQYVGQKNAGRSRARNVGLQRSRGEFVVFVDADDRLLATALQTGVESLVEHAECAFVSGHCRVIDAKGAAVSAPPQRLIEREHYVHLLRGGNYIWCPATVVYRRGVFDFVHGFEPALEPVEDYDLYLRITRDFAVHCHGQAVAEYRQHNANTSRDFGVMQRAALAAHRAHWPVAKAHKQLREAYNTGKHFWQKEYPNQYIVRTTRQLVREHLPPAAVVAVATGERAELLQLDGRHAQRFPQSESAGQVFAEGAEGSRATGAWIEPGLMYRFTLRRGSPDSKPIAEIMVRSRPAAQEKSGGAAPSAATADHAGAFLAATPNPVPLGDEPGSTTISWSTGDGATGHVFVSTIGASVAPDPADSNEALRLVEALQRDGVEYLVLPARSFYWLDRYDHFREQMQRRYSIVARVEGVCVILDLRGSAAASNNSSQTADAK